MRISGSKVSRPTTNQAQKPVVVSFDPGFVNVFLVAQNLQVVNQANWTKSLISVIWLACVLDCVAVLNCLALELAFVMGCSSGVDPNFTDGLWFKPKESEMSKYGPAYAPEFRQQLVELVRCCTAPG